MASSRSPRRFSCLSPAVLTARCHATPRPPSLRSLPPKCRVWASNCRALSKCRVRLSKCRAWAGATAALVRVSRLSSKVLPAPPTVADRAASCSAALDSFDTKDPNDPIDPPRPSNRYAPPRVLSSSVVVSCQSPPTRGTILAPQTGCPCNVLVDPGWRENRRSPREAQTTPVRRLVVRGVVPLSMDRGRRPPKAENRARQLQSKLV